MTGAIEEALEEKKAEPDRLADSEDGGRDQRFLHKTATNAARPLLAKRPKDEEEWVIKAVHK